MEFPEIIIINDNLRLKKPKVDVWFNALVWYQDQYILKMSEGIANRKYTIEDIHRIYSYLSKNGALYFIEVLEKEWIPIGDATFSANNLPIVIGNEKYRGHGIGNQVIKKFIELAKIYNIKELRVPQIYHYNENSKKLFLNLGFQIEENFDTYSSYLLKL